MKQIQIQFYPTNDADRILGSIEAQLKQASIIWGMLFLKRRVICAFYCHC